MQPKHILNYSYQAYWSQHRNVCVITWFRLPFHYTEKGNLQYKDSCFLTKLMGWKLKRIISKQIHPRKIQIQHRRVMGLATEKDFFVSEVKNKRPVGLSSFVNCPPVVALFLTQRQLSVIAGWQHMGRVPHPNYVNLECCVATVCHQGCGAVSYSSLSITQVKIY